MSVLSMNRNHLAFLVSLVALSATTVVWGDLFRWSKVVHLPEWAKVLPVPIMLPSYLAFVCLLPAAFAADSLAAARGAVLKCMLLAPLASTTAYSLDPLHQNRFLFANVLFNYAWIVLFFCALPALLVILMRAAINRASKPKHS